MSLTKRTFLVRSMPLRVNFALFYEKGQSILEALRNSGTEVESSCEAGTCGTCRTRYLTGSPDHQDFVLSTDEQEEFLMVCVSRSKSPRLVLDL